MGNPAESAARYAGQPDDEETRPDPEAILATLDTLTTGTWSFDPEMRSVGVDDGLDIAWMAPDMEGHPDEQANGDFIAAAPALLRQCALEILRLRSLAGIVS